jgi:hypothetical protein
MCMARVATMTMGIERVKVAQALPRPFGERVGVRGCAGHEGASPALTPALSQRERGPQ